MKNDFSQPQRLSLAGIVMMFAATFKDIIKIFFIPIILYLTKAKQANILYVVLAFFVLTIIILLIAYFKYLKFTFYIHQQEFILNEGIFSKTQLTIQLHKIQQVNINQTLLQKIFKVYSLQIDTAGTAKNEVNIKAITEQAAYSLKEHLLYKKDNLIETKAIAEITTPKSETTFLKISANTLLKVGITSNYDQTLALILLFVFSVYDRVKDFLKIFKNYEEDVTAVVNKGFTLFSASILFAIIIFTVLVVNIIRTFVKYFEFEISKHKNSLSISSGLFAKKTTLINPNKVQIVSYSQNYFQKKLNLLNMSLKHANGNEAENGKSRSKNNLEIPGCNPKEKDELLTLILGEISEKTTLFIPNYRFLNLPIFFTAVLPVGVFLILGFNLPVLKPYFILAVLYFIVVAAMLYRSLTKHRLAVNQQIIIKKSGIWDIKNQLIFPNKIQGITTFQYPWHKKVNIGHITLYTAAGTINFKYGNYTQIKLLANYWLYQVQTSTKDWM